MVNEAALNERAQHLLKVLIERYIDEGQPVGSRALARSSGLDISPATVRNVMADLEEMGLVHSPHTSAGRVPTVHGYRLFVDSLITIQPLGERLVQQFRESLAEEYDTRHVVETASRLLSGITKLAGVVMLPRRDRVSLRHVEFVPLSDQRVLAIMVTSDQEVQNRIIITRRSYTAAELEQAANYLTQAFFDRDLTEVRAKLMREMRETKESLSRLMETAIELGREMVERDESTGDYVLEGETNLMEFAELADLKRLQQLFEAFKQKQDILELFDQCMEAARTHIFIGEESGYRPLGECSFVTAPYTIGGHVVGVLGVIGPTRMEYQKVIPIVDVTAKLLGRALNSR